LYPPVLVFGDAAGSDFSAVMAILNSRQWSEANG